MTLGARWQKRWCEAIRGMRSSSTTRSYNSSSSTWLRGLLAVKAHPAVTGHMTRRSYCTARPGTPPGTRDTPLRGVWEVQAHAAARRVRSAGTRRCAAHAAARRVPSEDTPLRGVSKVTKHAAVLRARCKDTRRCAACASRRYAPRSHAAARGVGSEGRRRCAA